MGPFWALFGPFLGHFSPFLGHFLRSFCGFLVTFCEVDCKIKQNDEREGKNMQISAKINQKYAKLCKNKPFFGYKTLVLLKKRSKSTFQPMKVCSKWVCLEVSWVDFECFMHFNEGLDDFSTVFGHL